MGMTGHCVSNAHPSCPDSIQDNSICDCPCHIYSGDQWHVRYSEKPEWWDDPSEPRCDECGWHMEDAEEWCGNCGNCTDHCELSDSCEEWATEQLELMQGGN